MENSAEAFHGGNMKSRNFVQHMTEFDSKHKCELLNIFQYALLMIVPVVLLNVGIGELFSSDIDNKTLLELSIEIVGELFVIIVGLYFIHRFITFVPTYSETPYSPVNFITVISVIVLVLFTFQTHLNEKMRVVLDRVYTQVSGRSLQEEEDEAVTTQPNVRVSQPIAKPVTAHEIPKKIVSPPQPSVQPPPPSNNGQENMFSMGMVANDPLPANYGGFSSF